MAKPNIKTFIYVLIDPRTNEIRYVGKTVNPKNRFKAHKCLKAAKGGHLSSWISHLRKLNLCPEMQIIEEVNAENWKEREPL